MIVLGIETSCDDTSAAVYDGSSLLSNIISTQLIHRQFKGVVPELASRSHIELMLDVVNQALDGAKVKKNDLSCVAVTYGPGLAGSLLAGMSVAKGISMSLKIPFIGVNHLEGHIWSGLLTDAELRPPFVTLLVSGGHTQIVYVEDWGRYVLMGKTRDDAAGEAFDKVGKLLDLGYPGGPEVEALARKGNNQFIRYPRAFLDRSGFDFSFSGLKTAVLYHISRLGKDTVQEHLSDICVCFQEAVLDVLVEKVFSAAEAMKTSTICVGGGVAVNRAFQQHLADRAVKESIKVVWPLPELCSDNAGMIACAGHFYLQKQEYASLTLSPAPSLNFSDDQ